MTLKATPAQIADARRKLAILNGMEDGREYTTNDLSRKLGLAVEDVRTQCLWMARAGFLHADSIENVKIYKKASNHGGSHG